LAILKQRQLTMDKLNQLLSDNVVNFAEVFGALTAEAPGESTLPGSSLWLQGSVVAARAGYVLGEGELIHEGQAHRFHFSGLPPRPGAATLIHASGKVSRLRRLGRFSGLYLFCDSPPSAPHGRARSRLQNEHGVIIDLFGPPGDRVFDLPYGGLRVRLATA
jgi:hypothetical protein